MARSWCVNTLRRIAGDLVPFLDGRRIGIDMLDVFEVQTELIYRELVGLEILGELDESGIVALGCVMKALALLRDAAEKIDVTERSGYQASAVYDGNVGIHCRRLIPTPFCNIDLLSRISKQSQCLHYTTQCNNS